MGHRKNRKRKRRDNAWDSAGWERPNGRQPGPVADTELFALFSAANEPSTPAQCGACREFLEDEEGGRGTCLHPGSGVLAPWTDTPSCAFFDPLRARAARR